MLRIRNLILLIVLCFMSISYPNIGLAADQIYSKVVDAVKKMDFDGVKKLVKKGANIDEVDEEGYTPMHIAAWLGDVKMLELLTQNGANINIKTNLSPPICFAVENDRLDAVKFLIQKGAYLNVLCELKIYQDYPLKAAIYNENEKIVQVLVENGAFLLRDDFENLIFKKMVSYYDLGGFGPKKSIKNPKIIEIIQAAVSCKNKDTNLHFYSDVGLAAGIVRSSDEYLNKYQESFVYALCNNNFDSADRLVDDGLVKSNDAMAIAKVIGVQYAVKLRTQRDLRYEYADNTLSKSDLRLSTTESGNLAVSCKNKDTNLHFYSDVGLAAGIVRSSDEYLNRDQESFVYALCNNDFDSADRLVDDGLVKPNDAIAIAKVIGVQYTVKPRTQRGLRFEYAENALSKSDLRLCTAEIGNLAQYYANDPTTGCGKFTADLIKGDKQAIQLLDDEKIANFIVTGQSEWCKDYHKQ